MSKRILVVEDQEDNRQILRDLLANAGFDMIEAEDGVQAIAAASEHRPDLILMDIQLPMLDGYEATRRIKAIPDLRTIPIIVVTSYALSGDEDKARAAGIAHEEVHFIGDKPHEAIIQGARNHNCDLIVMASHNWKYRAAMAIASETVKVLMRSPIPVIVVHAPDAVLRG